MPKHVSLCPQCSECPSVTMHEDGRVEIGEAPHVAQLDQRQWNELVRLVKSGVLVEL